MINLSPDLAKAIADFECEPLDEAGIARIFELALIGWGYPADGPHWGAIDAAYVRKFGGDVNTHQRLRDDERRRGVAR